MQLVKSSGLNIDQAMQICNAKNKTSNKYQWVVVDDNGHHVYRVDTLSSKQLREYRNKNKLIMKSVCIVANRESNETPFWSGYCVTCDRPYCPYNFYKWGNGPR